MDDCHDIAMLEVAALVFALATATLCVIAQRSRFLPRALQWIREAPLVRGLLAILLLSIGPITARTKTGRNAPLGTGMRPPVASVLELTRPETASPPFVCSESRTNGVAMVEPTTNVVVSQACLLHGASEQGEWIESDAPFFRWGTNDIRRLYASPGCLSFGTMRHPYLGDSLPNGTDAETLVALRTPLGLVPEANWHLLEGTGVVSRFWHDRLPGGGRVLTWENALLDRLADRPVTIQAELRPNGDFVYRYDFSRATPTNVCLIGAQKGEAAVEALRVGPLPEGAVGGADWGCQTNGATIWRIDGNPNTNGVTIADIFSTSPLVELRWKNTADLGDLPLDPDGDGISSHDEIFLYDTDPLVADTDADGIADNIELMAGADPLDADEDGDGVPDGVAPAVWAANPLWAANSVNGGNVTITLNEPIPAGASATLVLGGLALPLRGTNTMEFCLPAGETIQGRLVSRGLDKVNLSLLAQDDLESQPLFRSGVPSGVPLLRDDPQGVLDGNSNEGTFRIAIPKVIICNPDGTRAVSECIHTCEGSREYIVRFEPGDWGLSLADCTVEGFERLGNNRLRLSVGDDSYDTIMGRVLLVKYIAYGFVEDSVLLWRCSMPADEPYPMTLEVGYGMKGDFKRILPRHSTNPPGRPTLPCRLTLTGQTEHPATVYLSCPKLRFGTSANEVLVVTLTDADNVCDFVVSGEIASEAMDDAVITVRRDGPDGPICATGAMTVVWVDPITIRTGQDDNFSPDNNSVNKPTPPLLGKQYVTMPGFEPTVCNVVEIRGMVHPASFPLSVFFRRDVLGQFVAYKPPSGPVITTVNDHSIPRGTPQSDDPVYLDVSVYKPTQSGFIYDLDTPGFKYSVFVSQPIGTMLFNRLNFVEYAFCEVGRCSEDFYWHSRTTLSRGSAQQPDALFFSFRVGHEDDNSAGSGLTTIGLD